MNKEDVIISRTEHWRKSQYNKEQPSLHFFSSPKGYFNYFSNWNVNIVTTGVPHFSKAHDTPLHSYERPTLVPAFAKKKTQRGFLLLQKKARSTNSIQCWFCGELWERQVHPERPEWPRRAPAPATLLSLSASLSWALSCGREHLGLISGCLCVHEQGVS